MGKRDQLLFTPPIELTHEEYEEELLYQRLEINRIRNRAWGYYWRWKKKGHEPSRKLFLSCKRDLLAYGLKYKEVRERPDYTPGSIPSPPADWFCWAAPDLLPGHRPNPKFHPH